MTRQEKSPEVEEKELGLAEKLLSICIFIAIRVLKNKGILLLSV